MTTADLSESTSEAAKHGISIVVSKFPFNRDFTALDNKIESFFDLLEIERWQ